MDTLALVKRVPTTDSKVRIAADGKSIETAGLEYEVNPYDRFAVEEALKTKEAKGGEVTVLCLGPSEAQKDLRTCVAMGADKPILLECAAGETDGWATARCLAEKIAELGPEIVFCGRQAVDTDDGQAAPRIATILGWACVTDASSFELVDGGFKATRDIEGGTEEIEGTLPVVVACNKGLNEPRLPNMRGIMMAKKKQIDSSAASVSEASYEVVSLAPPAERPAPTILGEGPDAIPALIEKLRNEAKVL